MERLTPHPAEQTGLRRRAEASLAVHGRLVSARAWRRRHGGPFTRVERDR